MRRFDSHSMMRAIVPWLLLTPALLLMGTVFVNALAQFLKYSFWGFDAGKIVEQFTPENYLRLLRDSHYLHVLLNTLKLSVYATGLALVVSYPVAYTIGKIRTPILRQLVMVVVFLPLLVSVVVRSYGWMVLLSAEGVVNWALTKLGLITEPLHLMFNETGVLISLTHIFLPFMVFPILSVLMQLEPVLKEAAHDLGASRLRTFLSVTLPLSMPGIVAGVQLVFTMCMTAFVTPQLLGGGRVLVLSGTIYNETIAMNWPSATAIGAVLLVLTLLAVMTFNRLTEAIAGR